VQRTIVLAALLVALSLISMGCGTSDSVKSITLSPTGSNFQGVDTTIQLSVNANYNSGKVIDVTNQSSYALTSVCCDLSGSPLPTPAAPTSGCGARLHLDSHFGAQRNTRHLPTDRVLSGGGNLR
jgi:hypothetical protein